MQTYIVKGLVYFPFVITVTETSELLAKDRAIKDAKDYIRMQGFGVFDVGIREIEVVNPHDSTGDTGRKGD